MRLPRGWIERYYLFRKWTAPLWVKEPNGSWRIFKYYSGEEISNYAHAFYSDLGMNVFLYALLN